MTLPSSPPTASLRSIRAGERGWFAFAIQTALIQTGHEIEADGAYGPLTTAAVSAFQASNQLFADGICGPVTQAKLVDRIATKVESGRPGLALGLLRGVCQLEASGLISVVNWTVPGGVDCGCVQRRVQGPLFDLELLRAAFDTRAQLVLTAANWETRRNRYLSMAWAKDNRERAGRAAALAHNWPAGAEAIATNGIVNSPDVALTWVPRDAQGRSLVRFPDGVRVETRQEWAEFYAMGGSHGEGLVSRYVTDWR